jgi:hypothetical protein
VIDSPEADAMLVTRFYSQLLQRGPEQTAFGPWEALLKSGTSEQTVLAEIAGSDEYFAKIPN